MIVNTEGFDEKIYFSKEIERINKIEGLAHITGGGFIENIPRIIPEGLRVSIKLGTWPVLP
ncbi:MAG: hypothetical protein HGA23_06280, partial [Bacteroidales bacterium]|nr:hypothetical protein [Bacteroidales bacterium]